MLPIGDESEAGAGPPLVTWALVALNVAVFLLEVARPADALQAFVTAWGVVPREYSRGATSRRSSRCPSGPRC